MDPDYNPGNNDHRHASNVDDDRPTPARRTTATTPRRTTTPTIPATMSTTTPLRTTAAMPATIKTTTPARTTTATTPATMTTTTTPARTTTTIMPPMSMMLSLTHVSARSDAIPGCLMSTINQLINNDRIVLCELERRQQEVQTRTGHETISEVGELRSKIDRMLGNLAQLSELIRPTPTEHSVVRDQ
ncbi:hypothetical protein DPMN_156920 [Dreissena polymorpha]|uniref:Uncharacterized protein n=1 Tax=Dreissena polymorpha TaxID=45954 RepID=A0A9D4FU14_DREPO|nr:hypothetical protein DPMN_156920 [Dreissena polymorpha]